MSTPEISASGATGATSRNRFLVPLAAVIVATLVIALTYAVSGRSPDSPSVLRLAGAAGAATLSGEAGPAAAGSSADSRSSSGSAYKLSGELPPERPADAPVYELAGPYDTSELAKVLDRRGLTVERGAWYWSQHQVCPAAQGAPATRPGAEPAPLPPDTAVSSGGGSTSSDGDERCAGSGGGTSSSGSVGSAVPPSGPDDSVKSEPATEPAPSDAKPVPAPAQPEPEPEPTTPAMTAAEARAAAAPVFDAVDLPIDDAEVTVSPYGASVWINPVVKGLPTVGYATRIEIARDKEISYASGFLGDLSEGDTYPLITAREAFDELPAPMTDMMCRPTPSGEGCEPAPQQEITGAVLGLAMQQTGTGDHLLVPAWLFAVKTWTEPLPQVAVEGRYLGQPEPSEQPEPAKGDPGTGQTEPAPAP